MLQLRWAIPALVKANEDRVLTINLTPSAPFTTPTGTSLCGYRPASQVVCQLPNCFPSKRSFITEHVACCRLAKPQNSLFRCFRWRGKWRSEEREIS